VELDHRRGAALVKALLYLALAAFLALILVLLWPGSGVTIVIAVAGVVFAFGLWGAVDMRTGIWGRATCGGARSSGAVALTYDDGPDPDSTPPLLDLLAERGVRAAFFCVGERMRAQPELVRRLVAEGHELGNHGDSHSVWTNFFSAARLGREVDACQRTAQELSGARPRFFRPPFGLVNHATAGVLKAADLELVGWRVSGMDLPGRDPAQVARRVLGRVGPGDVVLLHDGGREPELVVEATRAVLDGLAERGLRVAPLGELLGN